LLADFEEVPVEDEAARTKFEETVAKIKAAPEETIAEIKPEQAVDLDNALNIARTRVQETSKTAAPYIQNAVNAYRPAGTPKITLEQAKQIRQQLMNEGIITGKDKVKKVELTTPPPPPPTELASTAPIATVTPVEPAAAAPSVPAEQITEPTVTPAEEVQAGEEVVSYDDLERRQTEAAARDFEEEVEDVSAPADETIVGEAKPKRRRKGTEAPVSGGPLTPSGAAAVAEQKVGEAVAAGVDATSDTADTITAGEGRESAPLKEESAANPLETYQSLMRRLEGLRTAKRIDIFNFNRIGTQLRRGNPVTNPEGYAEVQREADELLNQYETAAEAREAEDTAQGIDQRARQLNEIGRAHV
jgi:hypothetical protein